MIINFEQKLRFNDLSTNFTDDLINDVKESIKADTGAMEIIKEQAQDQLKEDTESGLFTLYATKYNLKPKVLEDYINEIAQEKAEKAVESIRIYCEFDIDVKL